LCACVDSTRNRDRLRYYTPGADQAQHRHRDERRDRVSMALMSLIKLAKCLQESEGTKRPPAKSWWVQKLSADFTAD